MKCIGGRSAQVIRIYVVQAAMIGIIGSAIGALLGAFAQAVFARLVANYFDIAVILIWPWSAMFKGIAAAMSTAILFALPALLSIAEIKPALILRRDVSDESKPSRSGRSILAAGAIVAGLWGIGVWVASSIKYASVFAAVLLGSLLVFAAISAVLLRGVRRLASSPWLRRSAAVRHGIANLYRPGAHAACDRGEPWNRRDVYSLRLFSSAFVT